MVKLSKAVLGIISAITATATLFASTVVLYDPQSQGVTNRVVAVITSGDTPSFSGLTNVLINPTLPGSGGPQNWKVSGGTVVALTGGDLTAIANAEAAALTAKLQFRERVSKTNALSSATATALDLDARLLKALAETIMDELNILRTQIQLARTNTTAFQSTTNRNNFPMTERTMTQLRTAIITKLNAQSDNN